MFGVRLAKEDQAEQVFITKRFETNKYLDYIYLELLVILSENKIKFTLSEVLTVFSKFSYMYLYPGKI